MANVSCETANACAVLWVQEVRNHNPFPLLQSPQMLRLASTKSQCMSSRAASMRICNSCAPARNAHNGTHISDVSLAMQRLPHTGSYSALKVADFGEETYAQIADANVPR